MEKTLIVQDVSKSFGNLSTLNKVSLEVKEGQFVSLLGPSGSGKSTLFKIIAGLQIDDTGEVLLQGKFVRGKVEKIGYMPQKDLLLPWKKLIDNIALPLIIAGVKKKEAHNRVRELLPIFTLNGFEDYYPHQLSGGMRQRAALMRTVLIDSGILLLDEPFGALDALTREELQEWLLEIWARFKPAILFISHSIEEAIFLSDKIYVLSQRPGQVILDLEIKLPRPRPRSIVLSQDFLQYKEILLKALIKGDPQ